MIAILHADLLKKKIGSMMSLMNGGLLLVVVRTILKRVVRVAGE